MFNKWPNYSNDEVEAAMRCLQSGRVNYWTGEQGKLFENEFAQLIGTRHAIAVANGTVALELALYSLGIGQGDEVIVTPRSFIASASCIVLRGATPVFSDVDIKSQNITAESIETVITPRTKAIILVHHAGWPCEMDSIMQLAEAHGLYIIEDCAQATGAKYKGRTVGSFGHMAAFSFCQDKIISTGGEGGMLTTNDEMLWEKAWSYKDHGKNIKKTRIKSDGCGFRWLHDSFGTNWRMTEMQSAIGRVQLRKLKAWNTQRNINAATLNRRFSQIAALRLAVPPREVYHAYYKYYAFIRPEKIKANWGRDRIVDSISSRGVPCFTGSCPGIHLEEAFIKDDIISVSDFPTARHLGDTSLMFPVHPTLSQNDMEYIADVVEDVLSKASISEKVYADELVLI